MKRKIKTPKAMSNDNKEKALNLLIETYKLYAAFCAIIIAGLLSFASSLTNANNVHLLYIAIGALSLCSIFCILGIQNFISKTNEGDFNIYSPSAKFITTAIMILIGVGLLLGFLFLFKQDKLKKQPIEQEDLNKAQHTTINIVHRADSTTFDSTMTNIKVDTIK